MSANAPVDLVAQLEALPKRHSKPEIVALVESLQKDVASTPDMTFAQKVQHHSTKHMELYLSYPMLYRTVVKGTYRPHVVNVLLDARDSIESGQATRDQALETVIKQSVDEVNRLRAQTPDPSSASVPLP